MLDAIIQREAAKTFGVDGVATAYEGGKGLEHGFFQNNEIIGVRSGNGAHEQDADNSFFFQTR